VDDRDAAQGARTMSISDDIDSFAQRRAAPCRPPPYGFEPESRDAALRNPVDSAAIDRNTRLASRLSGSNATPSHTPTAS
ncbi:MAG: hypothetical protein AB7O55_36695, partial [Lautropia sp.]